MAHTIREKTKLLNRVRRIRGQVEAVERALEAEKSCAEVMHLVAAARGALNGFMAEIVEDHIRFHVSDPANDPDRERAKASEELIEVVHSYLIRQSRNQRGDSIVPRWQSCREPEDGIARGAL